MFSRNAGGRLVIHTRANQYVATLTTDDAMDRRGERVTRDYKNARANGFLIAAAPDLLAALRAVVAEYDNASHDDMQAVASDMVRIARHALTTVQP
jgi:hypothetical protein